MLESTAPHPPKATRPSSPDPLFSIAEVASWLGCHIATVRRLIDAKKLTAVRLSARRIGIRQSVVERYLVANETEGECA